MEKIISVAAFALLTVSSFDTVLHARVLKDQKMTFINVALKPLPVVTARVKLALKVVNKTQEELKVKTKKMPETSVLVKKMLKPVHEFFSKISTNGGLVIPLLEESFKEHPLTDDKDSTKTRIDGSLLIEYFKAGTKETISDYLVKKVTTRAQLDNLVSELQIFLTDLTESFSKDVNDAYDKMVEGIKAKRGAKVVKKVIKQKVQGSAKIGNQ